MYDLEENGAIRVTGHDGKTGLFCADGSYVRGDVYFADPHLCGWIGGGNLPSRDTRLSPKRDRVVTG